MLSPMDGRIAAFVGVALLLTITPGVDMALVTRQGLAHGRHAALRTTLGVNTGVFCWGVLSAVGVATLLERSATAFETLRWAGAAYLIWLGVQAMRDQSHHPIRNVSVPTPLRSFRQGLLTNLLNPKVGVFYTTFLPQFMAPGDNVLLRSLLLTGIHVALGLAWLSAYSMAVSSSGEYLRRPKIRQALDRLTGTVLIAFGARLALDRH